MKNKNHIKTQKSAIFVNKNLEINMPQIKKYKVRDDVIEGNIEVLHIAYVIQSIVYLRKFLQFFTMDLTMMIILS